MTTTELALLLIGVAGGGYAVLLGVIAAGVSQDRYDRRLAEGRFAMSLTDDERKALSEKVRKVNQQTNSRPR